MTACDGAPDGRAVAEVLPFLDAALEHAQREGCHFKARADDGSYHVLPAHAAATVRALVEAVGRLREHQWPCEQADGGAERCEDANCPASVEPALAKLRALGYGPKGSRPDYVGMLTARDAYVLHEHIAAQKAELARLRADAERWRFVRDHDWVLPPGGVREGVLPPEAHDVWIDRAIAYHADRARQAGGAGEGRGDA